jgi:very-short-patch-repair endonuclease
MKEYPTDAERLLWLHLQKSKLGLPFRRQYIIVDNIADFACLPARLVIEIDGGYHDDIRQQYHDQARTNEIEKLGFNVIRFTNEDIFTRLDEVIDIIKNKIT